VTGSAAHAGAVHQLDGHLDDAVHRYHLRVQYEDTDAGGIVYHAQYLAFAERARSAWLRCLGIDQQTLLASDANGFVVRHIDIDFVQAAGLSAVLEITSEVLKTGGASVKLRQTITNMQSCHIVARLVVDIGFVNLQSAGVARACCMPKDIRNKLAAGAQK
jgi:acyl-CoA thioester hydrolase